MKSLPILLSCLSARVMAAQVNEPADTACKLLQAALPGSVFFPGSQNYDNDIAHASASSSQNATCSVEPRSVEEISKILSIVGRNDIRSPFGVKSGGHAFDVGFSSTTGVEIALSNFKAVTYDQSSQTVKVGPGNTWDQVYAQLEQFNVTVPGGRIVGVGVGGLALGGGYSWITDQYGLTVDNTISYDLVLPNGTFTTVTSSSDPDLFFALKGGLNNFGIVTSLTLKAYPIRQVWGGVIIYGPEEAGQVASAIANYSLYHTDLKAQLDPIYVVANGKSLWMTLMFYNAPTPPPTLFKPFFDIPSINRDISTRPFVDLMNSVFVGIESVAALRTVSHTVPIIRYTPKILNAIQKNVDATYANAVADGRSITNAIFVVEAFRNPFAHSVPSAYPHDPSRPLTPSDPVIGYSSAADNDYFQEAMKNMTHAIQAVAVQEGQSRWDDICYNNYALGDTPLNLIYGDNLARLRAIKQQVDPANVMGLTGGFKL